MSGAPQPFVSVVVPCRNEERYIAACLESIRASDYPHDRMEVLVVDGMSQDRTREIVARDAAAHPWVHLLDNPEQITPAGLNRAIRAARGEVIVRMDAHVEYAPDYISRSVAALRESGADNVGGVIVTRPADRTAAARAIALGLSHPFGVGNSYFRIGTRHRRWVDTVAFGCFRREVFEQIGLFDEDLVRNQDDELNARLIRHGGRILLVPEIVSYYYARGSLRHLGRMYYQYGLFKPLAAQRAGGFVTVRPLVPPAFLLVLVGLGTLSAWWRPAGMLWGGVAGTYLAVILGCAGYAARTHGVKTALALALVFPVLHFSYALGFLSGLVHRMRRSKGRTRASAAVSLSR